MTEIAAGRRVRHRRPEATVESSPVSEPRRPVIAVVAYFDSVESAKIVTILDEVRASGSIPVLVDAQLFAGTFPRARINRVGGTPCIQFDGNSGRSIARETVHGITGMTRDIAGAETEVSIDGVTVVTADHAQPILGSGTLNPHSRRFVRSDHLWVDAVWPEGVDIDRRLVLEPLYRGLEEHRVPTVAPPFETVRNVSLKNRTWEVVADYSDDLGRRIPQPRTVLFRIANGDGDPARADSIDTITLSGSAASGEVGALAHEHFLGANAPFGGHFWFKPVDGTHSEGVTLASADGAKSAIQNAIRHTPDGAVCLAQEDIRTILEDAEGKLFRADIALVVSEWGGPLQATLRLNSNLGLPTNSYHGGFPVNIPLDMLGDRFAELGNDVIAALGVHYGSIDVFGGFDGRKDIDTRIGRFRVRESHPIAFGEFNLTPGGRSPGFREMVIRPTVQVILTSIEADRLRHGVSEDRHDLVRQRAEHSRPESAQLSVTAPEIHALALPTPFD